MNKHIKKTLALAAVASLAFALVACSSEKTPAAEDTITLKVGASPAPHAKILEIVKPILAEEGINLEIVEFTDYVLPNTALAEGELDANYFQHQPYLTKFNEEHGTDLVSVGGIHFEAMGVYPGKTATLDALADGAEIGIPNDATNEARALLLLQDLGLITLKDGVGLNATPKDITVNTKNLKFYETEAAQLPLSLADLDLAVVNGNYAVGSGIQDTVLATESKDSDAAKTFENILVVKAGNENNEAIQKLYAALTSDKVRDYITTTYANEGIFPVF